MGHLLVRSAAIFPRLLSLGKRGKCQRTVLRHITAHAHQVNHLPNLPLKTASLSKKRLCNHNFFHNPSLYFRTIQRTKRLEHAESMSDDAYSSFLDKANQDTGASKASNQSKSVSTKAVNTEVPATLQKVEQYYVSEADEPFEPVSLKWGGKNMPNESTPSYVNASERVVRCILTM